LRGAADARPEFKQTLAHALDGSDGLEAARERFPEVGSHAAQALAWIPGEDGTKALQALAGVQPGEAPEQSGSARLPEKYADPINDCGHHDSVRDWARASLGRRAGR
jgi:hypothetical protein